MKWKMNVRNNKIIIDKLGEIEKVVKIYVFKILIF